MAILIGAGTDGKVAETRPNAMKGDGGSSASFPSRGYGGAVSQLV